MRSKSTIHHPDEIYMGNIRERERFHNTSWTKNRLGNVAYFRGMEFMRNRSTQDRSTIHSIFNMRPWFLKKSNVQERIDEIEKEITFHKDSPYNEYRQKNINGLQDMIDRGTIISTK